MTTIGKRVLRATSIIATVALIGASLGLSTAWASTYSQRGMRATRTPQPMGQPAQTQHQTPDTVLLQQAPRTLDEYATYVQNRIQVAAMQLRQQGTADLRLTINRDGTIQQADIVDLEGPSGLRDQVKPLVNRISPLPPLPGNADALVVDTTVAFDYPGENILDRFGYLPSAGS